jgi:hypothetical protein
MAALWNGRFYFDLTHGRKPGLPFRPGFFLEKFPSPYLWGGKPFSSESLYGLNGSGLEPMHEWSPGPGPGSGLLSNSVRASRHGVTPASRVLG